MHESVLMQDPTWKHLLEVSAINTKVFAATFMGETFFRPFSKQSEKVFEAIDGPEQKVLILAHRGFGKTSGVRASILRRICYRQAKFIVMVSETASSAELSAGNLQAELTANPLILNIFGETKDKDNWSKQQFVAADSFILPRGSGQQVRGLNYMGRRPNWIIVDDLENAEAVESEDRRKKLKQWFFADLMNSVDRGSNNWKIVVIGTLLHENSLLADLRKDPTWKVVEIPLCDDDLRSFYPEFMSDDAVRQLYEGFREQGQADTFAREYQNKSISGLDAVFKQEYWKDKYYEPASIIDDKEIFYVTILDPAKTTNVSSDDSAIVTVGVNLTEHKIYFHDCVRGRLHPDEIIDEFFAQIVRHRSRVGAFEVTSLHEFISGPIYTEARRRGILCNFVELAARSKKELRIAQLAPFYRQGYIYHNKNVSAPLELQLMDFPRAAKDDVSDAFAYIIEVMELNEDYFFAPELPGQDEYADLDNENSMKNWRCA